MSRRRFLQAAPAALLAAPAVASAQPAIRWRLVSSFPKLLDTIYGSAEMVAQQVAAAAEEVASSSQHLSSGSSQRVIESPYNMTMPVLANRTNTGIVNMPA